MGGFVANLIERHFQREQIEQLLVALFSLEVEQS